MFFENHVFQPMFSNTMFSSPRHPSAAALATLLRAHCAAPSIISPLSASSRDAAAPRAAPQGLQRASLAKGVRAQNMQVPGATKTQNHVFENMVVY